LIYARKSPKSSIENLINIAIDYANQFKLPNDEWVENESENDLPIETSEYYVIYKGHEIVTRESFNLESEFSKAFFFNRISHYQKIIKPNPPIF
jgi:hypothetical protein